MPHAALSAPLRTELVTFLFRDVIEKVETCSPSCLGASECSVRGRTGRMHAGLGAGHVPSSTERPGMSHAQEAAGARPQAGLPQAAPQSSIWRLQVPFFHGKGGVLVAAVATHLTLEFYARVGARPPAQPDDRGPRRTVPGSVLAQCWPSHACSGSTTRTALAFVVCPGTGLHRASPPPPPHTGRCS